MGDQGNKNWLVQGSFWAHNIWVLAQNLRLDFFFFLTHTDSIKTSMKSYKKIIWKELVSNGRHF